MTAASLTLDAMRVTQAAGLKLRLRAEPGMGDVVCERCGLSLDVDLRKWVALPARERGCIRCTAGAA